MTFLVGGHGSAATLAADVELGVREIKDNRATDIPEQRTETGLAYVAVGTAERLEAMVAVVSDKRYTVLFSGFTFADSGCANHAARRILADCIASDGCPRPPKGHYVLVIIDSIDKSLRAYVDHLATTPLYYHEWRDTVYFATEVKALLPIGKPDKVWNTETILQSYLLGYTLDEATICREISYVPGGGCLVVSPSAEVHVEPYHDFGDPPVQTTLSKFFDVSDECLVGGVANVHETFRNAGMQALTTVSGGLDSRAVLAMLRRASAKDLVTVGWGQPGSADADIGAAVARIVGAQHLSRPYTGGAWMLDTMDAAVCASECMYSYLDAARMQQLVRHDLPIGCGPLYTGLSGDMVMGSFVNWRDITRRRVNTDLPGLASRIAVEYTNVSFFGLDCFAQHFGSEPIGRLIAAIRESLEKSQRPRETFYNHLDRWNLRNKQSRGIFAYYRSAAAHIPVFSPFYDPDLIEVIRGLPVRQRFAEAAYAQYLIERVFDDDMLRLPWQKSGTRLRRGLYRNMAAIWTRKVVGKLGAGGQTRSPFLEPTNANPYSLWLREDRELRERVYEGLTQTGSAALLQLEDKPFRDTLTRWVHNPEPFTAVDLNLIYMLSVVRFADRYGRYLSSA